MKYIYSIIFFISVNILFAQTKNDSCLAESEGYDVILVAGQSNTHYGYPLDTKIDQVLANVYALHRKGSMNYKIAPAQPSLDFWTKQSNRNSFAITFSNLYVTHILKSSERKVLIIPAGYAGSSITSWQKGANLYSDAMERLNYVLDNVPGSRLVAILWHQGEANVGQSSYQKNLDQMIVDMRNDVHQIDNQKIPFILGGMVPYWVHSNSNRIAQQSIIKNTPSRVLQTGYADSEYPTVISKPNNNSDAIHFDAKGQREMGKRYFEVYTTMIQAIN